MITAFSTEMPIDYIRLYQDFLERETNASGTLVLHHGRVKRPGKKVANFSRVELKPLVPEVGSRLERLAREAVEKFGLNQALLVHRLGTIDAGDSVLLAIVSAATRDRAFEACAWIVDEVKKEEFIELVELP
jgi:molybdopterin synthase catalytic subunit